MLMKLVRVAAWFVIGALGVPLMLGFSMAILEVIAPGLDPLERLYQVLFSYAVLGLLGGAIYIVTRRRYTRD